MRWAAIILLPALILLAGAGIIYLHQDKATIVRTPPAELAQWYKPQNKRQVWLHNMFKMRREMQAVAFYAQNQQDELLKKWGDNFYQHYLYTGEMIPQWQKKLDVDALELLKNSIDSKDYTGVLASVDKLQLSCDSCHNDYQAITALTYRAPDFSNMKVADNMPFNQHMEQLSQQVNQIKIATEDNMLELAQTTLTELKTQMNELGQVCVDCHKQDRKSYPSEQMLTTISNLEKHLISGNLKQQSRELGTLAVQACAQCHGTHRLAYGVKSLLAKEPSLAEMLRH